MWNSELPAWTMAKQRRSFSFGEPETPFLLVSVRVSAETKGQVLSIHLTRHWRESNHGAQGSLPRETGIDSQAEPESIRRSLDHDFLCLLIPLQGWVSWKQHLCLRLEGRSCVHCSL